jgi:hypothetical protein
MRNNSPQSVMSKSEGVNRSEQYLNKLANGTFLSLWSYPNLYNDKGIKKGEGKELCDLLVVFDNHILIFSVKECEFQQSDNIQQSWCRWYKKAILESANQVFGAERWILEHTDRVYLEKSCQSLFPYKIPSKQNAIVHRIVVAFGASTACKQYYGDESTGSLKIHTALVGDMHYADSDKVLPFTIGDIDTNKGFVHVFDERTLSIVMQTLDTASDFIQYLACKERFFREKEIIAVAEEDILATYLSNIDSAGRHCFLGDEFDVIDFGDGLWIDFCQNDLRKRQLEANKTSYYWDILIEAFIKATTTQTAHHTTHDIISENENAYRFMAMEDRMRRRGLSDGLIDLIENYSEVCKDTVIPRPSTRIIFQSSDKTVYLFLVLQYTTECYTSYNQYREIKCSLLNNFLLTVKLLYPDTRHFVGIGIEVNSVRGGSSEDFAYLDTTNWTDENEREAVEAQEFLIKYGILRERTSKNVRFEEYPQ